MLIPMDGARGFQLAILAASFYNVGAVMLAQMSWNLWRHVGRAEFPAYHRAWFRGMMPTIWPMAALAGLGALVQVRVRPRGVPAWAGWLGAGLQLANFGLTGAWWARWQAQLADVRLEDGSLHPLYLRLIRTHWLRVGLIAAFALLQSWMAAVASGREPRHRSVLRDDRLQAFGARAHTGP
jgi:hypothetical protein